ncbi:hypothetical protein HDU90_007282 [Geranomyces variabilis]|nr:hypothetical protein HDU90_007282 [Geranomyces variabilis]
MHSHTNNHVQTEAHGVKGLVAKAKAVLPGHKESPTTSAHRHEHDLAHNNNHSNTAAKAAASAAAGPHVGLTDPHHAHDHHSHNGGLVGDHHLNQRHPVTVEDNRQMAAALGATGYPTPASAAIHDPAYVHDGVTRTHHTPTY